MREGGGGLQVGTGMDWLYPDPVTFLFSFDPFHSIFYFYFITGYHFIFNILQYACCLGPWFRFYNHEDFMLELQSHQGALGQVSESSIHSFQMMQIWIQLFL